MTTRNRRGTLFRLPDAEPSSTGPGKTLRLRDGGVTIIRAGTFEIWQSQPGGRFDPALRLRVESRRGVNLSLGLCLGRHVLLDVEVGHGLRKGTRRYAMCILHIRVGSSLKEERNKVASSARIEDSPPQRGVPVAVLEIHEGTLRDQHRCYGHRPLLGGKMKRSPTLAILPIDLAAFRYKSLGQNCLPHLRLVMRCVVKLGSAVSI
jgi:hypothetical protein